MGRKRRKGRTRTRRRRRQTELMNLSDFVVDVSKTVIHTTAAISILDVASRIL